MLAFIIFKIESLPLYSFSFIRKEKFGLECHQRNPDRFRGCSRNGKRYNVCFSVERIILIKPTGEIVLLCRLLADPFIHASPLLPIPQYLLHSLYVIPMWRLPASAYEKSTPLHSNPPIHLTLLTPSTFVIITEFPTLTLSPNKDLFFSFTRSSFLENHFRPWKGLYKL